MTNGLTEEQIERLAFLSEELGEVNQTIGKVLRHGYQEVHPDTLVDNQYYLEKELADVIFAIALLKHNLDISDTGIKYHIAKRLNREKWYLHFNHGSPKEIAETIKCLIR